MSRSPFSCSGSKGFDGNIHDDVLRPRRVRAWESIARGGLASSYLAWTWCSGEATEESDDVAEGLKGTYKAAFFVMQELVSLRDREYVATKKALLGRLEGEDKQVLETCMRWNELRDDRRDRPEHYFSLLREWSSKAMKAVNAWSA